MREPYTCPRCKYTTSLKGNMKKHLFMNTKPCIGSIELSDDVKECVMQNRVYTEKEGSDRMELIYAYECSLIERYSEADLLERKILLPVLVHFYSMLESIGIKSFSDIGVRTIPHASNETVICG